MKGYFVHNLPNALPSDFGFAFIRSRIGMSIDGNLARNWENNRNLVRGLYQFPKPTPEDDEWEHSSQMIEDSWYHPEANWIVVCGLYVSFQWLVSYVGNLATQAPEIRPVIYMTYSHWDAIAKGDNIEADCIALFKNADMCISKYGVKAPVLPKYVPIVKFWEYESNKIIWEESGIETVSEFEYLDEPGSPVEDPPVDPLVSSAPKKWKAKYPPLFGVFGGVVTYEPVEE